MGSGDQIGVPDVAMQEAAYAKARAAFEADGRRVINASAHTALDVFDRCEFTGLFGGGMDKAGAEQVSSWCHAIRRRGFVCPL